jgi:hypothetical protein
MNNLELERAIQDARAHLNTLLSIQQKRATEAPGEPYQKIDFDHNTPFERPTYFVTCDTPRHLV